jgi:hypothetical protein
VVVMADDSDDTRQLKILRFLHAWNPARQEDAIVQESKRRAIDHAVPASLDAFAQTSMSDTFTTGFSADFYND